VPASALETLILPGRVPGYSPALLDELTSAGEIVWSGAGALPGGDGWLVLAPADSAALLLPEPGEVTMTPVHAAVLAVLGGGGALFFRMLSDRVAAMLAGEQASPAPRPAGRRPPPGPCRGRGRADRGAGTTSAGRRCRPAPVRPPSAAGGPCYPAGARSRPPARATPTRPCGRTRSRRRCSSGMA